MLLLMTKFLRFGVNECEGCISYFTKDDYMDKEIRENGYKNGKMLVLNVGCHLESLKT